MPDDTNMSLGVFYLIGEEITYDSKRNGNG